MSYQALYRAWRPDTFSEIVGQDAVTQTLKHQVTSGRIGHAYLFCGTRGTGKTTAAKVLARAVNCLNLQDGDPCGICAACQALASENCMDVMEIDAASNNGVDEIRDLREKVVYPPVDVRYKVYIIDEVHMLSSGAFNALLKTLEEPPAHAVFILATTEPQRLPATILSRCLRFDFHRIPVDTIIERLMVVLGGIGRTADDEALNEIARAAEGGMRDALSLMDVCLSYTDGEVTGQLARDVLGSTGRAFLFDFTDALLEADAGAALKWIDEAMRRGSDPIVFARDTAAHLRAIMLAGAAKEQIAEILEITQEDAQQYARQASGASMDQVLRLTELFVKAESDMRWASRPRTILELCAVRACHPEQEPAAGIEERVRKVEAAIEKGVVPQRPSTSKAEPTKSAASKAPEQAAPPPGGRQASTPPQEYLHALERFGADTPSVRPTLSSLRFESMEGNVVHAFVLRRNIMHLKMLQRKQAELDMALSDAFGRPMHMDISSEDDQKKGSQSASSLARSRIEQSYEVFGRENIEITE